MGKFVFGGLASGSFGLFFAAVLTGRLRGSSFLTDVQEFLTLALACLFFVVMMLLFERSAKAGDQEQTR